MTCLKRTLRSLDGLGCERLSNNYMTDSQVLIVPLWGYWLNRCGRFVNRDLQVILLAGYAPEQCVLKRLCRPHGQKESPRKRQLLNLGTTSCSH